VTRSRAILVAAALLTIGCGSQPKPQAHAEPKAASPAQPGQTSDGHYSEKYHYRVAYPPGTEAAPAEGPNAGDEGEFFTVHAADAVLTGEVSGNPLQGKVTAEALCQRSIEALKLYEDYDVRPDPAPPFQLVYKAVKPAWCVISGTRGDEIIYEKTILAGNAVLTLRLRYPAANKDVFNPLAARIAGSFERYMIVTAKAGVMVGEEGEPGLLFLDPLPDQAQNEHTTCAVDVKDRAQFSKVAEGQTVTVAGQPEFLNLRAQTEQYSGQYERRITHCALKEVRP
jgi:hypothetical protein